jgi:uncharacterized protein
VSKSRVIPATLTVLVALSSSLAAATPAVAAAGQAREGSAARAQENTTAGGAGRARESVVVTGSGSVYGVPDVVTVNFAVESSATTVREALDRASAAATRMRNVLVRGGTATVDLQTSELSVAAKVNEDREVTGYTASQGLTATLRDVRGAGALMSAALAAGGDAARMNGASLSIADPAPLLAEARKRAFADARAKAELYAAQAGRSLGRVVRVSEEGTGYQPKYGFAADAAVPVEPGRQQLTATVTVEWSF